MTFTKPNPTPSTASGEERYGRGHRQHLHERAKDKVQRV